MRAADPRRGSELGEALLGDAPPDPGAELELSPFTPFGRPIGAMFAEEAAGRVIGPGSAALEARRLGIGTPGAKTGEVGVLSTPTLDGGPIGDIPIGAAAGEYNNTPRIDCWP